MLRAALYWKPNCILENGKHPTEFRATFVSVLFTCRRSYQNTTIVFHVSRLKLSAQHSIHYVLLFFKTISNINNGFTTQSTAIFAVLRHLNLFVVRKTFDNLRQRQRIKVGHFYKLDLEFALFDDEHFSAGGLKSIHLFRVLTHLMLSNSLLSVLSNTTVVCFDSVTLRRLLYTSFITTVLSQLLFESRGAGGEVESRKGGCEATLCLSLPRVIRARFSWVASRQPASTVHRNDEPSTSTSNDIRPMTLALGTNEGVTFSPSTRSLAVKWAAQQSCNT